VIRHEHELGEWTYARRDPDQRLAPLLYRELIGFRHSSAAFDSWLESPRPAMTMMINLEGAISDDGVPLPDAWVAGLGDTYSIVGFGGTYGSVDLELNPLGAYTVLGRPLSELAGSVVALDDLFGAAGLELAERIREASCWEERFDLAERFLLGRAADGPAASPAVAWAWERLCATHGQVRVETLAAELGCSRRYLHSRFLEQIGIAPKTVSRLLRFQHVCARLERDPVRWADVALEAGYYDQSHLNREFRDLAGTTPGDFLARRIPGGGFVGDEIPFVQDAARSAA
jgi:AraC-like DNA-binding protein